MSFVLEHMRNNIWRGKFSSLDEKYCIHGLSARLGGVSKESYDSLNMALHVGDDPVAVWENRCRFIRALGLNAEKLVTPEQIHGSQIMRVDRRDAGRGAREYSESVPKTDALITNEPGLPLLLCFADCTPVLFLDLESKAVGIAHAGWKGTAGKIAQKTVMAMTKEFGTKPEKVLVAIGPAIGSCCYEVGDEVAAEFRKAFPCHTEQILSEIQGRHHLNLWEANRLQLMDIGVKSANIELADTCTACNHQWFFSYRADSGRTGRMAAVIALNEY